MATPDPLCNEVPTKTWVLPRDIDCSGSGGLTVTSRSGVTIDLNGHTISTGSAGGFDYGISVYDSRRVKILNGAITDFDAQIYIDASSSVTVDNVVVSGGDGTRGISVTGSSGVKITNAIALGASSGEGFYFEDNLGSLTVSKSSTDGFSNGIVIRATATDLPSFTTTLSENVIVRSNYAGIYYEGLAGALVATGNVVLDAGNDGINATCNASFGPSFVAGPVTITGNRVLRSSATGIFLFDCRKGRSTISGNVSAANQTGLYGFGLPNATWTGNRAPGNDSAGFEIYEADGSTFKSNRADANGSYGFDISDDGDAPPAAIDANFARGNDWGGFLITPPGDPEEGRKPVTDLSADNVAFGNGDGSDEDQCAGVTCIGHADSTDALPECGDPVPSSIVLSDNLDCSAVDGPALTVPSGTSRVTIDLNGFTIKTNLYGIVFEGPGPAKSITIKNGYLDGGTTGAEKGNIFISADGSSVRLENLLNDGSASMLVNDERDAGDNDNVAGVAVTADDIVNDGSNFTIYGASDTVGDLSAEPAAPPRLPNTAKMSNSTTGPEGKGPWANVVNVDRSVILAEGAIGQDGSVLTNSVVSGYWAVTFDCALEGGVSLSGNLLVGPVSDPGSDSRGVRIRYCKSGNISNNIAVGAGGLAGGSGFFADKADGMKWTANRAFGNFNGFELVLQGNSAVIKGNFADGNANDGFYIVGLGAGKVFSSNVARGNTYIGFESFNTELNGSGNIAFGNGDANCVQVTCKLPA